MSLLLVLLLLLLLLVLVLLHEMGLLLLQLMAMRMRLQPHRGRIMRDPSGTSSSGSGSCGSCSSGCSSGRRGSSDALLFAGNACLRWPWGRGLAALVGRARCSTLAVRSMGGLGLGETFGDAL